MRNQEREAPVAIIEGSTGSVVPREGLITLTHVIYALHAFSALTGLLSSALIVTAFLSGWPSIIAVILNYIKRPEVRGTFLDSHFSWQIRTFWFALVWLLVGGVLLLTLIGIPMAIGIWLATGIWVVYRITRGWMALSARKTLPV
jgi:uncharacterized membrane protein